MLEPLREAVSEEGGFEFVGGLLSPDPVGRPGAEKALRDPWLKASETGQESKGRGGMLAVL